ncbi:MAG: cell division protein FtsA [Bacteroidia bacterium]|nr:cell division protein FtsA [Bacteroidota bacterium]MCZ2130256.1 cell division protein FtsA [Bacteroidia bacterium]
MSRKNIEDNRNKVIVGLDVGTTKICAIVGMRNENGKINILGIGRTSSLGGITEGVVTNINKTTEAIKKAIQEAERSSNIQIGNVYVGIAGRHINSFTQPYGAFRSDPNAEISAEELEEIRKQMYRINTPPGTHILHVLPQDYIVDGNHSDDPIGMPGSRIDINYHIITGQIIAAENIKRCIQKCDIAVEDVVVEPIASAKSVLTDEELLAGVAILDIGGGTSDLAIFHEGRIRHTAVVPIGGQRITKDICEAFAIMEKYGESMKVRYGNALPEGIQSNEVIVVPGINGREPKQVSLKNLSIVINARLMELFQLINNEIKQSDYQNKLTAGIVLTGGGAELKNISLLLEYVTGKQVKIGYPNQYLAKGAVAEAKSPMFATGTGLVIYGMDKEVPVNNNTQQHIGESAKPKQPNKNVGGFFNKIKGFGGSFMEYLKDDDNNEDFQKG